MSNNNANTYRKVTAADLLASGRAKEIDALASDVVSQFNLFLPPDGVLVETSVSINGDPGGNDPPSITDTSSVSDAVQIVDIGPAGGQFVGEKGFLTTPGLPKWNGRRLFISGTQTSCHGFMPAQQFVFGRSRFGGTGTVEPPTGQVDSFGLPKMFADSPFSPGGTGMTFKSAPWEAGISTNWDSGSRISQWDEGTGTGWTGTGVNTYWDGDVGTDNIRYNVSTGSGVSFTVANYDRGFMASKADPDGVQRGGYMYQAADWRNVEYTYALFMFAEAGSDDNCGPYFRGGAHSDSIGCQGFAYHVDIYYNGPLDGPGNDCQWQVNKETSHGNPGENIKTNGAIPLTSFFNTGSIVGQWVFIKVIVRNLPQAGFYASPFNSVPKFPVNIQQWILETGLTNAAVLPSPSLAAAGNWVKGMEVTDDLTPVWGNNGGCGGPDGAIGSWGGPFVSWRADLNGANQGYGHVRMAYLSIREVDPALQVNVLG